MLEVIALLAPSLMAIGFYNHLHRNSLRIRQLVSAFGIFVVCINLCLFLIWSYILNIDQIDFSNSKTFIAYMILALISSFVWPFVVNLLETGVAIKVKKNDKE